MNVTIAHNAVTAKLVEVAPEIKHIVSELLSYEVNGAEYSSIFKSGRWDGRSSFFKHKTATFPAGFVRSVSAKLKRRGHNVRIIAKDLPKPLGDIRPNVNAFGYTDEYSYQPETVDKLIERGSMVAQLATGAGKSNVASIAVARIKRPTLFITTRGVLLHQMKAALEESFQYRATHGEPELTTAEIGVIGDGIWSPKRVTVAMVQTLASKLKDPDPFASEREQIQQKKIQAKVKELLSKFELVILEEAHEASGDSYFNILKECVNAHYRLALTATPWMKDDAEDNMRLMACVGPIGIRVTEKELIDKGILAKPYFKFIDNPKPANVSTNTSWQRAYKLGIVENESRNTLIVEEALKMKKVGLSVITLVQHTNHGDTLNALMKKAGLRVSFIRGSSSQETRKDALNKLGSGTIDVLIGTNILDVGVDVPSVGAIILAGGGKAEVALRQRIGRGLRRKKSGPNVAYVVDFLDSWNSHTHKHAQQRKYIVENTEGFGDGVISNGCDFNWSIIR